jgi:hypothetical protein
VDSICAVGEGEVSRRRGEGSSNRATREGRRPRTMLVERGGELEPRHRIGEVGSIRAAGEGR